MQKQKTWRDFSAPVTPFMPLGRRSEVCNAESKCGGVQERLLQNAEFFASGREALMRALSVCKAFERTLWLPSYFCPWVVKAVKKYAWGVAFYGDSPLDSTPNLDSLRPGDSDIVVAVDYFGIRDLRFWARWKKSNPDTALIADISHSPFSAALSDDTFDFVFASLRKTMPITDGGYLYGAKYRPAKIYTRPGEGSEPASACAFAAALAQLDYSRAQDYYYNAEMRLNAKQNISRISFYSLESIKMIDVSALYDSRREVFCAFESEFGDHRGVILLKNEEKLSFDKYSLFCPTLAFENVALRDRAYAALAKNGVLPSIYWGAKFMQDEGAKQISGRMLTIPLDFRHNREDARNVARILNGIF